MNNLRSKKDFIDGSKTITIKDFNSSKTYDLKNNKNFQFGLSKIKCFNI